jgi:hypothetical protein
MVTVRGPAPEEFDIDKEAPKVEAAKKDSLPKEAAPPPPKNDIPKGPPPGQGARLYAPPGAGCSVMMPQGEVKPQTLKVPLPTGDTLRLEVHMLQQGANVFMLSLTDAPASMGSGVKLLDGAREQITTALPGAKVTREDSVTVDKHPGKDLTIEIPKLGITRARVVAVGQKLYQASVLGTKDFAQSAEADRYLQSLKILPRGNETPPNPGGGQPFPGGIQPVPPNPGGGNPFPGKRPPFPPNPGGGRP